MLPSLRALLALPALTALALSPSTARAQQAPSYTSGLGTNLHFFKDWAEEWSTTDAFKASRPWVTQCELGHGQADCTAPLTGDTGEAALLDLDAQGWVRSLPAPEDAPIYWRVQTRMFTGVTDYPAGQYVVLYDGEGTMEYGGDATKNVTLSAPGRDVLDVTPSGGITLTIAATDPNATGNYLRNIRVILPGFEATYETQRFHPTFLSRVERYKALRYQQWARTNGSIQEHWADRPKVDDARWTIPYVGVPIEIMVEVANATGADPWFCVPHLATDDYVAQFAALVRDSLGPGQKAYVEYSNETWSDGWEYPQGAWAQAQADAMWPNANITPVEKRMNWIGMRMAQICDIWKGAWGEDADRVVCVAGSQHPNEYWSVAALDCPLWTEGAPCYAHGIDAVATNPYFNFRTAVDPVQRMEIEGWLQDADGGLTRLFNELFFGGELTTGNPGGQLQYYYDATARQSVVAQARGVELVAYEGGNHLIDTDPAINNLYHEANRDPRMGLVYDEFLADWRAHGGGLLMHYVNVARSDDLGAFGALEYLTQATSPKWEAINRFMDNNPCWWGCRCGDGVIDAGEACDDGNRTSGDCCSSICQIEPATTECRPAAGVCDTGESCDGVSPSCPADVLLTTLCRPIDGACDVAEEHCDGASPDCPADGAPLDCSALDDPPCAQGACDPEQGCVAEPINELGACSDGDPETLFDACVAGVCGQNYPPPVLASSSPSGSVAGGTGFTLQVTGEFIPESVVYFGQTALATTYVSPTELSAAVPASAIASGALVSVTVANPAPGGPSGALTHTVSNPAPIAGALSPQAAIAGAGATVVVVSGSNLVPTSVVHFAGTPIASVFVSSTRIDATVPSALLALAGDFAVQVVSPSPGGGGSAAFTFRVNNDVPLVNQVVPYSAVVYDPELPVTIGGSGFMSGATASVDGIIFPTAWVSPWQLTAIIPASAFAAAGTYDLTVSNPAPTVAASAPVPFQVYNPAPVLAGISPSHIGAGGPAFEVAVSGSRFVSTSVVLWDGSAVPTTFAGPELLLATIGANLIPTGGTHTISVSTPMPQGGVSSGATFTVDNPGPTLTSVSPATAAVGTGPRPVTLTGSNFVTGSIVTYNGTQIASSFVSSTQLSATVPASMMTVGHVGSLVVTNPAPSGAASGPVSFTVTNPVPGLSYITPTRGSAGGGPITLTLTGVSFMTTATVLFNNQPIATTYTSQYSLQATIPESALTTPGLYGVVVNNPAPGGGTSVARTFTLNASFAALSFSIGQTSYNFAGGVAANDEDLVRLDGGTYAYSVPFRGSTVGLPASADISAFAVLPDGSYVMSFETNTVIPGLQGAASAEPQDVVRWNAGQWSVYFDGSDVGLSLYSEGIDALHVLPDGRLLISTIDAFSVTGASGLDEDLVAFTPVTLGANTAGTWAIYFRGADVGLEGAQEDLDGISVLADGSLLVSIQGVGSVPGITTVTGNDVLRFIPTTLGAPTSGSWQWYLSAASVSLAGSLDALQ